MAINYAESRLFFPFPSLLFFFFSMKLVTISVVSSIVFPVIVNAIYLWPVPQSIKVGHTELELDVNNNSIFVKQ